jgi:tryptophan synthase alpha chain
MTGLDAAFAAARTEGRAALVGYLPAGFPSYDGCLEAFRAMVDGGVDVVEVGLPYSDPLMDGPTIQAAVDAALTAGVRTADVLRTVEAVAASGVPALVMTYWNPIDRYGPSRFAADLARAGGAGAITPDLLAEEAGDWLAALDQHKLAPVFLVAPSSTAARIRRVGEVNRGFVYAASTMGVTGARAQVSGRAESLVKRVRAQTELPVAVGLGVSNRAQAAEVASYADGVIVGSALVAALADGGPAAVGDLTADLAAGVRARPAAVN